jgi:hydroxyacylglutathione hydrolase
VIASCLVLFQQFLDDDLGCASYLVGDEDAGVAAIVDPPYAIEPVLEAAARREVEIVRVVETHTHADHLSGHGRLALEHGIPVSIHGAAEAAYPHDLLEDGAELELGQVVLRAIHTPGHRPEHTCLAVIDRTRADEPWLVLTGDSLFVGDAARPDLAVGAKEGAEGLFHSLRRLLELPDGVEVFPGHIAGSLCGKGMSSKGSSTIGFERRFNRALQITDELDFIADASTSAPKPPNMSRLVDLNRGAFVGAPSEVSELAAPPDDAVTLDVRDASAYGEGHRLGALNVPVSGSSFATKAGFVLDVDDRIVVQASSAAEAGDAIRGLRAVGFLELEGYVLGGGSERIEPVDLDELARLLEEGVELIDVRERDERDDGYIAGSRNIPYRLLPICGADVPRDRPVVTICESGARAGIAASILAAKGVAARPVLDGGISDWAARGGQMVEFRRCGS